MKESIKILSEYNSDQITIKSEACDLVMGANHPAPENGGPCATCAFRKDTEANRSPHTVMLAKLCVEGFRTFSCHEKPGLCRGFVAALNVRGIPQNEGENAWAEACGVAADVFSDIIDFAAKTQKNAEKLQGGKL